MRPTLRWRARRAYAFAVIPSCAIAIAACNSVEHTTDASSRGGGAASSSTGLDRSATTIVSAATSSASAASTASTGASTGSGPALAPAFVLMAHGGFVATTCDEGTTWHRHDAESDVAYAYDNEWTAFARIASGGGRLVAGFGWDAPGHVLRSNDGIAWQDLSASSFAPLSGAPGLTSPVAAVVYDADGFLVFGDRTWRSADGESWHEIDAAIPGGGLGVRRARAFPDEDLLFVAVERAEGNALLASTDGGVTFDEASGDVSCVAGLQWYGDIEMLGDVVLVGATGFCRSEDRGRTWHVVPEAPYAIRDLFTDGVHFWAVTQMNVYRSTDGLTWETTTWGFDDMGRGAYGDGTYMLTSVYGTGVFRSDDGFEWTPVPRASIDSTHVTDFVFARVDADCAGED